MSSSRAGSSPALRPGEVRAWFPVLLLLLTLGVHVWPTLLPWRAQTLHRDLPWAGLGVAVVLLALAFGRLRWPSGAVRMAVRMPGGRRALALGLVTTAALVALTALPTILSGSRAGLTVRTGAGWGAPDGTLDPRPARRLEFSHASGGPWERESFFAEVAGRLYVPVEGRYQLYVDVDADVMAEVDREAVVGRGSPDGQAPPGATDAESGFRRGPVYLEAGYHHLRIRSRHEAGTARLRVRWTLPWMSHSVTIPAEHLVPADATPRELALGGRAMAGRRIGVLGLAGIVLWALSVVLRVVPEQLLGRVPLRLDCARSALLVLLFFVLTGTPLLVWPEQRPQIAPLLLGPCAVGILALGAGGFIRAGWQAVVRIVAGRSAWTTVLSRAWPPLAVIVVQGVLVVRFLTFVNGRLPLPGDHSSFLYRYHALLHTLPRLRFYDPWWNAGAVDPSPALSGATGVLALSWPFLAIWSFPGVYPLFLLVVGVLVAPWSLYATTRLVGGSRFAALLAALLVLAPGDVFFWWFMAHGTVPAILSSALAPLVVALAWRVFGHGDHRWHLVVALSATLFVGLFWAGFVLMIGPALVGAAVAGRRRLGRRDVVLAALIGGSVLLAHAHWLLGLLWLPDLPHLEVSGESELTFRSYVEDLLGPMLFDPNPIGLVLGGIGVLLLPRGLRRIYGTFVLSLLAIATLLHPVFSRLELDRFLVPLGIALIPPAAWVAARLLRALGREPRAPVSALLSLGLLAVLLFHLDGVWRQYSGQARRTGRQIEFLAPPARELVDWIRRSASPDGRVLLWGDLPGPSRLEGGYKAYLQPLTGRPLIGYHVNPKWVDLRVVAILQADDLLGALDAFNVRHIVVTDDHPELRRRLDRTAGIRFREALSRFVIYDVETPPSYVAGGRGTVTFDYDRLDVRLADSVDQVTLKFRWAAGLVSDPPLHLEPVEVLPGVRFIRVRTGGVRAFRIGYTGCCAWHPAEIWARWRSARR